MPDALRPADVQRLPDRLGAVPFPRVAGARQPVPDGMRERVPVLPGGMPALGAGEVEGDEAHGPVVDGGPRQLQRLRRRPRANPADDEADLGSRLRFGPLDPPERRLDRLDHGERRSMQER